MREDDQRRQVANLRSKINVKIPNVWVQAHEKCSIFANMSNKVMTSGTVLLPLTPKGF